MKALVDLHIHTISAGHAYSTVKENIDEAKKTGLKYMGISEHACAMPGGPHPFFFGNIEAIPREVEGITVVRGIEANIINSDGEIDVEEHIFDKLDYVIASLHSPCIPSGTKEVNTNTILKVLDNPRVKIIGHLDDSKYPVDYDVVAKKAKENNVLLEINNSSLKPKSSRLNAKDNIPFLLESCKKYNTRVIMNSDSHFCTTVGKFDEAMKIIEECDFPLELVINYYEDQIREFLGL